MKIRQDNRGLSLVELIIAIAVSTIILGAVTMFIYSAHKSYKLASETIDLQVEAQLLTEQLGNWIMESNEAAVLVHADAIGEVLVLYDIPANNGRNPAEWKPQDYAVPDTNAVKRIVWASGGKLFMKKVADIENAEADKTDPLAGIDFTAEAAKKENIIGELVQQFHVNYDETKAAKLVSVAFIMQKGSLKYDLQNAFKMRNGM